MGVMTISEFKSDLDDAFARAEAGEVIQIMKGNRVVVELRPRPAVNSAEWQAASAKMLELMRRGFHLGGGPFTEEDKYGDAPL